MRKVNKLLKVNKQLTIWDILNFHSKHLCFEQLYHFEPLDGSFGFWILSNKVSSRPASPEWPVKTTFSPALLIDNEFAAGKNIFTITWDIGLTLLDTCPLKTDPKWPFRLPVNSNFAPNFSPNWVIGYFIKHPIHPLSPWLSNNFFSSWLLKLTHVVCIRFNTFVFSMNRELTTLFLYNEMLPF